MKKLIDFANEYVSACDWKDISLLKLCLCALGVILGINVKKEYRRPALISAFCVFFAAYIPLMAKCGALLLGKIKMRSTAAEPNRRGQ